MEQVTLDAVLAAQAAAAEAEQKLAESVKHAAGYARQVEKRTPLAAAARSHANALKAQFERQQPAKKTA
jgi:hypothetical protein